MTGKVSELNKLSIFNTPYRLKVKGIAMAPHEFANFYMIETHGKLYALEITGNQDYILHDNLNKPEDIDFIMKNVIARYKLDHELIIDDTNINIPFKSNIFDIKTITAIVYDKRTLSTTEIDRIGDVFTDEIFKLIEKSKSLSKKDFTNHLFGKSIESDISLDSIIDANSKPKAMGCRTPLPTLADFAKLATTIYTSPIDDKNTDDSR